MRWRESRRSDNVEDRRGVSPAMAAGGGIGTLLLILLAVIFGADPRQFMQGDPAAPGQAAQGGPGMGAPAPQPVNPAEEEAKEFVSVVLADTEDVWNNLFKQAGGAYEEPKLVLFSGRVESACGLASAAVGPFYCPGDSNVYLDLSFFDELKRKFRAPGEFAQAYVIAHEIGHHVQNLLGQSSKVDAARRRMSKADANALSVRMELQADFYAGVWAHHAQKMKNIMEKGDVESALRAATAIGDDKIQMQAQGYVVPDAFTHGTSDQRVRWFKKGLQTGDLRQGDTFSVSESEL